MTIIHTRISETGDTDVNPLVGTKVTMGYPRSAHGGGIWVTGILEETDEATPYKWGRRLKVTEYPNGEEAIYTFDTYAVTQIDDNKHIITLGCRCH